MSRSTDGDGNTSRQTRPARRRRAIGLAVAAALTSACWDARADSPPPATEELPSVVVSAGATRAKPTEKTGAYLVRRSRSATKLDLSVLETPQSTSVVTRAMMDDFNLTAVTDMLSAAPGVRVESVETDRTYFTARGFDIINFQLDGVGVPFVNGNLYGDLDSALYDRIDVVRGANGLMSGTGDPSATINFVRKRPTAERRGELRLSAGSWDNYRADADVSGALTGSGAVRGRLIVAGETKHSYLDRYGRDKLVAAGLIEADLSENTLLTAGYARQATRADSPLWGALPLAYSDGTPTDYHVSTSTAADWAYWNNTSDTAFVELDQRLANDWRATFTLQHLRAVSEGKMFYAYGNPERGTGLGLFSYPSRYDADYRQWLGEFQVGGPFTLGGREHELVAGLTASRSTMDDLSRYGRGIGTPLPDLATWNGDYPEPAFDASTNGSVYTDRQLGAYLGLRLELADALKLIGGARVTHAETAGVSYGVSRAVSDSDVTPYLGVVYDLNKDLAVYASYTEIFRPQSQTDRSKRRLDPATGDNYELGVKQALFGKKVFATAAVFRTRQSNLAEADPNDPLRQAYRTTEVDAQGIELEAAGEFSPGWKGVIGYTRLSMEDPRGDDTRTYVPRQLLRLSTTYAPTAAFKIGAKLHWQDETYRLRGDDARLSQPSYALLDLMASYDLRPDLNLTLNLNNVTGEKYLTSLYWDQAYYGAPFNANVALRWKF